LRVAEVLGIQSPERNLQKVLEQALDLALEKKDPQKKLERPEREGAETGRSAKLPSSGRTRAPSKSGLPRNERVPSPAPCGSGSLSEGATNANTKCRGRVRKGVHPAEDGRENVTPNLGNCH
jgi:hypothetical protein